MTDYRQQAIEDVIAVANQRPDHMTTLDAYRSYALAQREARLRLEELLADCIHELSAHEGDSEEVTEFRAALNAVQEG